MLAVLFKIIIPAENVEHQTDRGRGGNKRILSAQIPCAKLINLGKLCLSICPSSAPPPPPKLAQYYTRKVSGT